MSCWSKKCISIKGFLLLGPEPLPRKNRFSFRFYLLPSWRFLGQRLLEFSAQDLSDTVRAEGNSLPYLSFNYIVQYPSHTLLSFIDFHYLSVVLSRRFLLKSIFGFVLREKT